jgi:hypothetical protein
MALDVSERQRIMQLLVKEILVGDDKIIISHCIALPNTPLCGCAGGCASTTRPQGPKFHALQVLQSHCGTPRKSPEGGIGRDRRNRHRNQALDMDAARVTGVSIRLLGAVDDTTNIFA